MNSVATCRKIQKQAEFCTPAHGVSPSGCKTRAGYRSSSRRTCNILGTGTCMPNASPNLTCTAQMIPSIHLHFTIISPSSRSPWITLTHPAIRRSASSTMRNAPTLRFIDTLCVLWVSSAPTYGTIINAHVFNNPKQYIKTWQFR